MDLDLNVAAGNNETFDDYLFHNWNVEYEHNIERDTDGETPMATDCVDGTNRFRVDEMPEDLEQSDNDENSDEDLNDHGDEIPEDLEQSDNVHEIIQSSDDDEIPEDSLAEDDFSLTLSIEKKLSPGSHLLSMDQAYLLYCEYGRLVGFSVKKGPQKYYTGTKTVRRKDYLCSCHGSSNSKETRERLAQYRKQDSRCMCPVKLRINRTKDGKWLVTKLVKEHNHELADKDHTYLLRSCRNMSHADKSLLEAFHSAGIRVKDAYRFMEQEAGGVGNAGFIRKDAYHHMDNVRKEARVEHADANALVKHFMAKTNSEQDFYWNMQTDSEGRVLNFFFRDSRSAVDFDFFGDVISVDTTYKTNKYDLICAPFIGVNHHMKNCLLGLGFLSDETTETFVWLFSCFREAMHGKEPDLIFSDQSRAMMNAFAKVFKSSTHRLCQWHINRNGPSYFGSLNFNEKFKESWNTCMNECETVDQFEKAWTKMLDDFELQDVKWFRVMYSLKERWSTVFTRHKFCAGLHATSRSEVTNKVLKEISSSSSTLHEFVMKYEQTQLQWRQLEGEDDTTSIGVPGLLVTRNPLLKQAAKFFTRAVFLSYEYEATRSINVDIVREIKSGDPCTLFKYEIKDCDSAIIRNVTYDPSTCDVYCSCCVWESVGVLCSHIFKVLYHHNLKELPAQYMLRRLSKEAKKRRGTDVLQPNNPQRIGDNVGEDRPFKSHMMRSMHELLYERKLDSAMKEHMVKLMESLTDDLDAMEKKSTMPGGGRRRPANTYKNATEAPPCRDPKPPANRRFTNTRISAHWEKGSRKGKKRSARDLDIGDRNPIPKPRMRRNVQRTRTDEATHANTPSSSAEFHATGYDFANWSPSREPISALDPLNFYATQ